MLRKQFSMKGALSRRGWWAGQAKALGDQLVVGLVPDSEIRRCKGPPVMNEAERHTMVESVKWVDEVLTGAARPVPPLPPPPPPAVPPLASRPRRATSSTLLYESADFLSRSSAIRNER